MLLTYLGLTLKQHEQISVLVYPVVLGAKTRCTSAISPYSSNATQRMGDGPTRESGGR